MQRPVLRPVLEASWLAVGSTTRTVRRSCWKTGARRSRCGAPTVMGDVVDGVDLFLLTLPMAFVMGEVMRDAGSENNLWRGAPGKIVSYSRGRCHFRHLL